MSSLVGGHSALDTLWKDLRSVAKKGIRGIKEKRKRKARTYGIFLFLFLSSTPTLRSSLMCAHNFTTKTKWMRQLRSMRLYWRIDSDEISPCEELWACPSAWQLNYGAAGKNSSCTKNVKSSLACPNKHFVCIFPFFIHVTSKNKNKTKNCEDFAPIFQWPIKKQLKSKTNNFPPIGGLSSAPPKAYLQTRAGCVGQSSSVRKRVIFFFCSLFFLFQLTGLLAFLVLAASSSSPAVPAAALSFYPSPLCPCSSSQTSDGCWWSFPQWSECSGRGCTGPHAKCQPSEKIHQKKKFTKSSQIQEDAEKVNDLKTKMQLLAQLPFATKKGGHLGKVEWILGWIRDGVRFISLVAVHDDWYLPSLDEVLCHFPGGADDHLEEKEERLV